MSFDGIVTRAIVEELTRSLPDARVSKIYQPTETDTVWNLRARNGNLKLLISASPSLPRLHLTTQSYENPLNPPMFCMLLRKYCEGGVIESVRQVGMERIIHIDIKSRDELGDWKPVRLIFEIMGRHSNLILIDPEKNTILDGIHHVTPSVSRYRTVLPGRPYVAPPEQNKTDPLTVTRDKFESLLQLNAGKLDQQLVNHFSGISPLVAREILHRAGLPTRENVWNQFQQVMERIREHQYQPTIVTLDERSYFSVIALTHLSDGSAAVEEFTSVSDMLESFYREKSVRDQVRQRVHDLSRLVQNEINKNLKKIKKLQQTEKEAENAEQWKLYGELVTAYMHQIKRGDSSVRVINYYDESSPEIEIPLDPVKTPAENAQLFFKKYNKAKTAVLAAREQLEISQREIEYLEGILIQLEYASLKEVEDVREELTEQGYIKERKMKDKKDRRRRKEKPEPEKFISSEGIEILVGKNNRQNDYLTNRLASSQDTWLHTKDIPGSHVVIRSSNFGEETLKEAAMLAAYYSKARQSSQVPVDYTLIKHVKKPAGTKPGYVIYENQKTLFITPDEASISRLKHK